MAKDSFNKITDFITAYGDLLVDWAVNIAYSIQNLKETRIQHHLNLNAAITSQDTEDKSGSQHASTLDRGVVSHVVWAGTVTRTPITIDTVVDWRHRFLSVRGFASTSSNGSEIPGGSSDKEIRSPWTWADILYAVPINKKIENQTRSRLKCDFLSGGGATPVGVGTNYPFDQATSTENWGVMKWEDCGDEARSDTISETARSLIYVWADSATGDLKVARDDAGDTANDHDTTLMILNSPKIR